MNDDRRRRHLDLFSGIGGFALAAHWAGFETVAFCEKERFCQGVLERHWPHVPIIEDIHDFRGGEHGEVELLTGGFPCTPFSISGKRRGKEDHRALWPEMARIVQESKPTWIIAENVAGILSLGIGEVLADLEGLGYEMQTFLVPACAVGAPHRRDRVWITGRRKVSNSNEQRLERWVFDASANKERRQQSKNGPFAECSSGGKGNGDSRRDAKPDLGLLAHGLSAELVHGWDREPEGVPRVTGRMKDRINMLKGLGNAIVPQVAYEFLRLMK